MPHSTLSLHDRGQSLWLDNLTRDMLDAGTLKTFRDQYAVTGLTSNPTIFRQAIKAGTTYNEAIDASVSKDPESVFFNLAIDDLRRAASVFEPVHHRTMGVDGWVSLEVSPQLADDAARTVEQALRLYQHAKLPNLYIKVPGTTAGLTAIEELVYQGISVNVTLLFSVAHYQATANAYMKGLERRLAENLTLDVASVASVFISRWDVKVARLVPEKMRNQLGLAVAGQIYACYCQILASSRMQRLLNEGARPQRLLWASTGNKDPTVSDTFYVDRLVAPLTINTLPEKTLNAWMDHGCPGATMDADDRTARAVLARFAGLGLAIEPLAATLQDEGVASFMVSWNDLLATIRQRLEKIT